MKHTDDGVALSIYGTASLPCRSRMDRCMAEMIDDDPGWIDRTIDDDVGGVNVKDQPCMSMWPRYYGTSD